MRLRATTFFVILYLLNKQISRSYLYLLFAKNDFKMIFLYWYSQIDINNLYSQVRIFILISTIYTFKYAFLYWHQQFISQVDIFIIILTIYYPQVDIFMLILTIYIFKLIFLYWYQQFIFQVDIFIITSTIYTLKLIFLYWHQQFIFSSWYFHVNINSL